MSRRFSWAKSLPKPDPDELQQTLSDRLQPVQGLPAPIVMPTERPVPIAEAPAPEPTAAPTPAPRARERILDRRDGRRRTPMRVVDGRIRGGKYSGQWGRDTSDLASGDWVGVRLPPGYNARLKQMAAAHDLYVWQVLTEAVDLFVATHGERPKHGTEP